MAESDYPSWARQFQSEMSASISESLKNAVSTLSDKIDGLIESNRYMEEL